MTKATKTCCALWSKNYGNNDKYHQREKSRLPTDSLSKDFASKPPKTPPRSLGSAPSQLLVQLRNSIVPLRCVTPASAKRPPPGRSGLDNPEVEDVQSQNSDFASKPPKTPPRSLGSTPLSPLLQLRNSMAPLCCNKVPPTWRPPEQVCSCHSVWWCFWCWHCPNRCGQAKSSGYWPSSAQKKWKLHLLLHPHPASTKGRMFGIASSARGGELFWTMTNDVKWPTDGFNFSCCATSLLGNVKPAHLQWSSSSLKPSRSGPSKTRLRPSWPSHSSSSESEASRGRRRFHGLWGRLAERRVQPWCGSRPQTAALLWSIRNFPTAPTASDFSKSEDLATWVVGLVYYMIGFYSKNLGHISDPANDCTQLSVLQTQRVPPRQPGRSCSSHNMCIDWRPSWHQPMSTHLAMASTAPPPHPLPRGLACSPVACHKAFSHPLPHGSRPHLQIAKGI